MSKAPKKIWVSNASPRMVFNFDAGGTEYIRADIVEEIRDWLWVFKEHNRLYFGDNHSTVIQVEAALKQLEEV